MDRWIDILRQQGARALAALRGRVSLHPVHGVCYVILRIAYPLLLVALPIFVALFGDLTPAAIAMAGAAVLIAVSFRAPTRALRQTQIAGAVALIAALGVGLPGALYQFSTESCVAEARDLSSGDVRSLSDPRLSADQLSWTTRAHTFLALTWPATLPPLEPTTLANILVRAQGVATDIALRRDKAAAQASLWEAKEAYAARHFDRRRVCHLYRGGDYANHLRLRSVRSRKIATQTEEAVALILPALQATYEPPVETALTASTAAPRLAGMALTAP